MRRAWLLAFLLVLPSVSAYHLSAGANDGAGVQPSEPPASVDEDTWDTVTRTDCPTADSPDPGDPTQPGDPGVVLQDALCGLLVYNSGDHETTSPADQAQLPGLPEELAVSIDLVVTSYVGTYSIATCQPWCNAPEAYQAAHDLGQNVGLTPEGEEAWEGDRGNQLYGANLYLPSHIDLLRSQDQSWMVPLTDTSLIGFVLDAQGQPVDPERLDTIVEEAQSGPSELLSPDAIPKVCVYSPMAHLGSHAADSSAICELPLQWMGPQEDRDEYQDPCSSPSYLCGEISQAWRADTVCPMWHAACYLSDAWNSAHHPAVWHAVVAPSPQGCEQAEPGFDTEPGGFLAHDVDIYEPPTHQTPAKGVPFLYEAAAENVPGAGPLRDGRAPDVSELPLVQTVAEPLPLSHRATEPNSDGWHGIHESSQTLSEPRSATDCDRLGTDETDFDPWVNLIDAHVTEDVAGFGALDLDGQGDSDQDPALPRLVIGGNVGFFADTDDDGFYEPAPANQKLSGVQAHGAYPILWDHHAEGEGCQFDDGTTIGDISQDAGYTTPTGLVSVLHLTAGVVQDTQTGNTFPVLDGDVVLLSQGLDREDQHVKQVIGQATDDEDPLILEDAFGPQCGEPTGGFTSHYEVYTQPMEGDGMITAAIISLSEPGPGGDLVPASPIELDAGTQIWWDTDPFQP